MTQPLLEKAREAINDALAYLQELQGELEKPEARKPKKQKKAKRRKALAEAPRMPRAETQPPSHDERPISASAWKAPAASPSNAPEREQPEQWWDDFHQITSKGIEAGVVAVAGQSFDEHKARVFAAVGPGPHLDQADAKTKALVRKYQIEGINPPPPPSARKQPVQSGR